MGAPNNKEWDVQNFGQTLNDGRQRCLGGGGVEGSRNGKQKQEGPTRTCSCHVRLQSINWLTAAGSTLCGGLSHHNLFLAWRSKPRSNVSRQHPPPNPNKLSCAGPDPRAKTRMQILFEFSENFLLLHWFNAPRVHHNLQQRVSHRSIRSIIYSV